MKGIAIKVVDRDQGIQNAEKLLAKLGIPTTEVHKVQQIPLDQILIAAAAVTQELGNADLDTQGFAPSVGGTILPQYPFHPTASAVCADVPVMIGLDLYGMDGLDNGGFPLVPERGWDADAD